MIIQHNIDLKGFNTFGIEVQASSYCEVQSIDDVKELVVNGAFKNHFMVLGGGSNMLLTQDFDGLIVHNRLKGIDILEETNDEVVLSVSAGENWHETVMYCVDRNWSGIENLSLIPGCVGAAPIQNIGAYGVEIKDVLLRTHFIDLETGEKRSLANSESEFEYRSSIFKKKLKNKVLITSIDVRLTKKANLKLEYGAIREELSKLGNRAVGVREVSNAVIAIRQSKLPDPAELGNSGSFFKNPIISREDFNWVKNRFPDVRSYDVDENRVKLAAGWLIEQCGWKGKRVGNTGSHAKQALVLVNYGDATGAEVRDLAFRIIESVRDTFGVELEPEVNII